MQLPKIQTPIFNIEIPSTKKTKKFRPFLVKEEKILLLAQQGNDSDLLDAITQIINNCCLEDLNISSLASFDLEYIFLKLRARSVNNLVELKYRDKEDDKIYTFEVDLDNVDIIYDLNHTNKIKINDQYTILMKYPGIDLPDQIKMVSQDDVFYKMIVNCIDKVYNDNEIFKMNEYSFEEAKNFIDNLDVPTFEKIQHFFNTMPKLLHRLEYVNANGTPRVIDIQGIKDFFM
jgi:hypothetical protein